MRYLLIFVLLYANCYAQKLNIQNGQQQKLQGVSILMGGKVNTLIGISDSLGNARIELNSDSSYLFHLLGYKDLRVPGSELAKNGVVVLEQVSYELDQIDIKKKKYKAIRLINRPVNYAFGAENSIRSTIQALTPVSLEKGGFVKKFSLFALQPVKGEIKRQFKLLMFESVNGKPGDLVGAESVDGYVKGNKLIFDLMQSTPYLLAGDYFFGYESIYTSAEFNQADFSAANGGLRSGNAYLLIRGKNTLQPKMFVRWNLSNWKQSNVEMAYELEMDVNN